MRHCLSDTGRFAEVVRRQSTKVDEIDEEIEDCCGQHAEDHSAGKTPGGIADFTSAIRSLIPAVEAPQDPDHRDAYAGADPNTRERWRRGSDVCRCSRESEYDQRNQGEDLHRGNCDLNTCTGAQSEVVNCCEYRNQERSNQLASVDVPGPASYWN